MADCATGSMFYEQADYRLITDNLLDFSHLGLVHQTTLGGGRASAEVRAQVDRFDWGVRVTRIMENAPPPSYAATLSDHVGAIDRWQIYDWHLRGNVRLLESGFASTGRYPSFDERRRQGYRTFNVQALTPAGHQRTHHHFAIYLAQGTNRREHLAELVAATDEDKRMIEGQQEVIRHHPMAKMSFYQNDEAAVIGSRQLEALLSAERCGE